MSKPAVTTIIAVVRSGRHTIEKIRHLIALMGILPTNHPARFFRGGTVNLYLFKQRFVLDRIPNGDLSRHVLMVGNDRRTEETPRDAVPQAACVLLSGRHEIAYQVPRLAFAHAKGVKAHVGPVRQVLEHVLLVERTDDQISVCGEVLALPRGKPLPVHPTARRRHREEKDGPLVRIPAGCKRNVRERGGGGPVVRADCISIGRIINQVATIDRCVGIGCCLKPGTEQRKRRPEVAWHERHFHHGVSRGTVVDVEIVLRPIPCRQFNVLMERVRKTFHPSLSKC